MGSTQGGQFAIAVSGEGSSFDAVALQVPPGPKTDAADGWLCMVCGLQLLRCGDGSVTGIDAVRVDQITELLPLLQLEGGIGTFQFFKHFGCMTRQIAEHEGVLCPLAGE